MMVMMIQVKPVEEDRRPSAVYLDVIVRGAKENGLPKVTITIIVITIIVITIKTTIIAGVHREAGVNRTQWLSWGGGSHH